MDNERPIEKLLRRYAKKRRDDAGAPSEMHPATRRLLQGEVARQFRKERSEQAGSSKPSVRWLPRLVYGLCALAVIALVAAMLLPGLTKSKSRSFERVRGDNQKGIELAASTVGEEKDNQLEVSLELARTEAPAFELDKPAKLAKATDDFGLMVTNSTTLAYAEAPQAESSTSLATQEKSALPRALAVSGVIAAAPATTPPAESNKESTNWLEVADGRITTAGLALGDTRGLQYKTGDAVQRNSYAQSQAVTLFSNTDKVGSKASVLVSFQVEQVGDEMRVIDSDGSTYAGNIVTAVNQSEAEINLLKKAEQKAPASQSAARKTFDSVLSRDSSGQNAFFRVSGTNKTLKQKVVFTGNFVTVTNAVQPQLLGTSGSKRAQNLPVQQAFPLQLNNSIIVGRAQLEKDKDIEVNAVPVSQ